MRYLKTFEEKQDKFRVKIVKDWTLPNEYVKFKYTTNDFIWHYIYWYNDDDDSWEQFKVAIGDGDFDHYIKYKFSTLDKIKKFEDSERRKLKQRREEIKIDKQRNKEKEKHINKKIKDYNKK